MQKIYTRDSALQNAEDALTAEQTDSNVPVFLMPMIRHILFHQKIF